MPTSDIHYFQKRVRDVSKAKIDLEYNPLSVPENDVEYFGFLRAHVMNGFWLERRVECIDGAPKFFYMFLICIQKMIAKEFARHLV